MSTSATVTILCRHCGRPIIGTPMKMGGAGDAYHAECTLPPRDDDLTQRVENLERLMRRLLPLE